MNAKKYKPADDEYVLITGASSGIGLAIAEEYAAKDRRLILVGRSMPRLRKTVKKLYANKNSFTVCITADLSRPGSAEKLYKACKKGKLKVETLINNAGIGLKAEAQIQHSLKECRSLFQLNCESAMELATLFGRDMADRGKGRILNVASTSSYQPLPYTALYAAGKAFLLSLSEAMHIELRESGVTVTAVCPGITDTGFFKFGKPNVPGWLYRMLTPEEVARKAIHALEKRKPSTIPSLQHWCIAQLPRLLPRRWMLGLVRIIEKKRKRIKTGAIK